MVSQIRTVRALLRGFLLGKSYIHNVISLRLCHNLQTELSVPRVVGLIDWRQSKPQSVEKIYFRDLMENNSKYEDLAGREKLLKANEQTANKLVLFLRNAIYDKTEKISENFEVANNLKSFDEDAYTLHDLIEIFHLLPQYFTRRSEPSKSELFIFNDLIMRKIKTVPKSSDDLGTIIALLNVMKDFASFTVCFNLLIYVLYKLPKLPNVQVVEFFYILQYYRLSSKSETKYSTEAYIANLLPDMTLDEIAVICYAFFRSNIKPGSLLITAISERIVADVEKLNDLQACTIFKCLNYSGRRRISENLIKIFEKCIPIVDKFSLATAVHLVSCGVTVNVSNNELFDLVWKRANNHFDELRLKDIERLLLTALYANVPVTEDSHFVRSIVKTITTNDTKLSSFPRSFLSLLNFLIMYNIYIDHLIKFALSDEFLTMPRVRKQIKCYELLFIYGSVQLERPEIIVNPISQKLTRTIIMKSYEENEAQVTSSKVCLHKIMKALEEMYGQESIVMTTPLTHYVTSHPILCVNRNNEPQKIGDKLNYEKYKTVKAPKDGNLWIAFLLLRWQACLYDRVTPNFVTEAKLRHFRAAGYIPVMVHNFLLLKKTEEETKQFLTDAVKNAIQSVNNESETSTNEVSKTIT